MRKKISSPVIDECRLEFMLQEISRIDGLEITHDGQIEMPEDTSFDQQLTVLHGLVDSESRSSVRFRLLIGNCLNAMSRKHGDKAAIVQNDFPHHDYTRIRKYAWVAGSWAWNPGLSWGWSWYYETAGLTRKSQLDVLAKWNMKGYTIDDYRKDKESGEYESKCTTSYKSKPIPCPTSVSNTKYIGQDGPMSVYVQSSSGKYVLLPTQRKWIQVGEQCGDKIEADVLEYSDLGGLFAEPEEVEEEEDDFADSSYWDAQG